MLIMPLVTKIAELFLILFCAAALVRLHVVKSEDSRILSRISLYFVTPCVVLNSFRKELTPEILHGFLLAAALAAVFQALFLLLSLLLRRVWKATEVERASVVFTNAGNLIIPLVSYIFGPEWVIYTSAYILVFNLMFWTLGIRMFDRSSAGGIRKVLTNPNILAILAGLLLLLSGLQLPGPLAIAVEDVAGMIGPFSMIITGLVVGGMRFSQLFANRRVFGVLFFRMIVFSGLAVLLAVLLARFTPITAGLSGGTVLILIPLLSAVAPSASNINQVAILYNRDAEYASAINVLTTLSCIATIPLWVMVFETLTA